MAKKIIETLVIEDDPFAVAVIEHYGSQLNEFELNIHHTIDLEESLAFLDSHPEIELILLDYRIHSKITGLEILQHIRAKGFKVPVIVITGSGNEEIAVTMLKAGACDYLVKGRLTPALLEKSIRYGFQHSKTISEALSMDKESSLLKDMAIRTSLNGVCMMDLDGIIEYINPSFVTVWGYRDEGEVIGRSIREFLYHPERFDEALRDLKIKKSWLEELVGKRKDGSQIYVQALFSLIGFKTKESERIMASFIDISRIKEAEEKREALYKGIMEVFALRAEDVGNVETAGHIHRVAAYTQLIAERLSEVEYFKDYIDEKYISDISYASMLHDVGKWRTPNEILLKPSELNQAEWEIIKQHPKLGVEMLTPLLKEKGSNQYLRLVESIVLYHHERWDGTGYPEGLKGEEIPLSARIVSLADMYDALTSDRSYRKALTHEEAKEVMEKEKDKFDPRIWKIYIDNEYEFKSIKDNIE
jgi:putative two-component system response regulator